MLPSIQADLRRSIEGEFDRRYGARFKDLNELEQLRKKEAERSRKEMEEKGAYDKARAQMEANHKAELLKKDERVLTLENHLRDTLINSAVAAAASRSFNPGQVAQLLAPKIRLDPESMEISVADKDGSPIFDKSGKPLSTVKELVDSFLTDNPHFVPPAQPNLKPSGASGSRESVPTENPEIARLEDALSKATERAARSNARPDVAAAYAAKRALEAAKKATRRTA